MNTHPCVSVLMTTYNRESYLAAAIESVLVQTFEDFELLIVDDHSSDRSADIAARYARQDLRIRVRVNDSNRGDYGNRNYAATLATGEFIKYHDSDDIMYPHCLATMVSALAAEPRAGFALSNAAGWSGGPCPMLLTPRLSYQREFLGHGMFNCGPAVALFRTDVFRQLGGFPEGGAASDYLFWLKACGQVNALLVPADLFWYRIHEGQEYQSAQAAWDYARVHAEAWQALSAPGCPLTPTEREQAKRNLVHSVARLIYRDLCSGHLAIARHRMQSIALSWLQWLRYLRRSRRDLFAGTPRDDRGEFIVPEWVKLPPAETPRSDAARASGSGK